MGPLTHVLDGGRIHIPTVTEARAASSDAVRRYRYAQFTPHARQDGLFVVSCKLSVETVRTVS